MKQLLSTVVMIVAMLVATQVRGSTNRQFYLSPGGIGDGSSWQQASGDLVAILTQSRAGDQLWVAAGTYLPSHQSDRNASFVIPEGVQVYGGFAGYETSLNQRSLASNHTVLSGDIGLPGEVKDNSYTVVSFQAVTGATVLDGFHITGGYADGSREGVDYSTCGGGIFVDSWGSAGAPIIRNCVIRENYALYGGGLYVHANRGSAAPVLLNCAFKKNHAELYGGGVLNDSRKGNCSTVLTNCHFIMNVALYGAGIANQGHSGSCIITLQNCHFTNNFADLRGGAILSENKGEGEGQVLFKNCSFNGNTSTVGRDADEADYKVGTGAVTF